MSTLSHTQQRAVSHKDGPMLVLAGPGSGKTTVITQRTRHLIETYRINPSEILVITFTKAAAREMKERFLRLTGADRTQVSFGTFHAVFFQILKLAYGYTAENILREEQKYQFLPGRIQLLRCFGPKFHSILRFIASFDNFHSAVHSFHKSDIFRFSNSSISTNAAGRILAFPQSGHCLTGDTLENRK